MKFDDITTDTIETSQESIHELAGMVSDGQTITCQRLVVDTESGRFEVAAVATELEITEVDEG